MRNSTLIRVREAIRNPYAWPGGYPIYTVLYDGALLCATCARIQAQDWFTVWTDYTGDTCSQDDLLTYCGHFFFGQ